MDLYYPEEEEIRMFSFNNIMAMVSLVGVVLLALSTSPLDNYKAIPIILSFILGAAFYRSYIKA